MRILMILAFVFTTTNCVSVSHKITEYKEVDSSSTDQIASDAAPGAEPTRYAKVSAKSDAITCDGKPCRIETTEVSGGSVFVGDAVKILDRANERAAIRTGTPLAHQDRDGAQVVNGYSGYGNAYGGGGMSRRKALLRASADRTQQLRLQEQTLRVQQEIGVLKKKDVELDKKISTEREVADVLQGQVGDLTDVVVQPEAKSAPATTPAPVTATPPPVAQDEKQPDDKKPDVPETID